MAKTTRNGKAAKPQSSRQATAWAKASVAGPSVPPSEAPKAPRARSGDAERDAANGGADLAAKLLGTEDLAGAITHNPLKSTEYGERATRPPEAGKTVEPLT